MRNSYYFHIYFILFSHFWAQGPGPGPKEAPGPGPGPGPGSPKEYIGKYGNMHI